MEDVSANRPVRKWLDGLTAFVDRFRPTIGKPPFFSVPLEARDLLFEFLRIPDIVRIERGNEFTGGFCDSAIARGADSPNWVD